MGLYKKAERIDADALRRLCCEYLKKGQNQTLKSQATEDSRTSCMRLRMGMCSGCV